MRMRTLFVVVLVLVLVAAACAADEPAGTTSAPQPTTSAAAPPEPTTTTTTQPVVAPPTTITTPETPAPDVVSPALEITLPASGERVHDVWCPFEGTTEPGVTLLAADRYPIEVGDDGSWSTVLRLNPGGNVATFTATDAAGNVTEARLPLYYDPPLVLRADGLGDFDFGDGIDAVMAGLTAVLGDPTSDRVTTLADVPVEYKATELFSVTGYAAVEYFRAVEWASLGLEVRFSDQVPGDAWPWTPGPVVINGYTVHSAGEFGGLLFTASGAYVGISLAELGAMYGDALRWYPEREELTGDWHFTIDSGLPGWNEGETLQWYGRFDGDPVQPPTHVAVIQAGYGYDEC